MTKTEHLIGYIKASNYRKKVVRALEDKKLTPAEIAKETSLPLSHISNVLGELSRNDIVICLTPELKKGRLYDLTKEGRNILKFLT